MNGRMGFASFVNPHKRAALAGLRSGKLDVAGTAKLARVSERSIRAWAKLAGLKISEAHP